MRPSNTTGRAAALAALATIILAAGCGSSSTPSPATGNPMPAPAKPVAFTEGQILTVHLGASMHDVVRKLGPSPYRVYRGGGLSCLYYRMAESSKGLWRLCFKGGKLSVISTYFT